VTPARRSRPGLVTEELAVTAARQRW